MFISAIPSKALEVNPDVDRALGMAVGLVECPPDSTGYLVSLGQLHRPLGYRPDQLGQVGHALVHLADVIVGGGDHHRECRY